MSYYKITLIKFKEADELKAFPREIDSNILLMIIITNKTLPKRMIFPKKINLFNRNLLSFRQKKVDEATHEKYQSCKENENAIAKMTHCGQKALSDEGRE